MKRIFKMLMLVSILIFLPANSAYAASNPYPTQQDVDKDGFYEVPCTRFAWQQAYDKLGISLPGWGDAVNWWQNAINAGYPTGNIPQANSIAVWSGGTYGHVAYVTSGSGNTFTVNEGGRTDKDNTDSHGIVYGYTLTNAVGNSRPYDPEKTLLGFIYLDGAPAPHDPVGAIDEISATATGKVHVRGWIYDPDSVSVSSKIHVYIGGSSATAGAESYAITANVSRKDVDNNLHIGEFHGFDAEISTNKTGTQDVYIYGINTGQGGNVELGHKTINIGIPATHDPVGEIEEINSTVIGKIHVKGWVYDPDAVSVSSVIHVYVGGSSATSTAESYAVTANISRKDIDNKLHIGEFHGFDAVIDTNKRGTQDVYIYGINKGAGGNIELGHKTIKISTHGHSYSTSITKKATCTEKGIATYTCECGDSYTEEIPAKGHKREEIPASAPKCTSKGHTAGAKCSVCGEIIEAPKEIDALGHYFEAISGTERAATCTEDGKEADKKCTRCNTVIIGAVIKAKGHTVVIDKGIPATRTSIGLTDGSHCSVCNATIIRQQVIPALDDKANDGNDTNNGIGTISADGKTLTDTNKVKYYVSGKLKNKDLKKNLKIADKKSGGKYKITKVIKKNGKVVGGNVTYMAPYNKNCTKATAGATVKLGGVSFKITALNASAFKDCKKLTKFKAGGNMLTIGKNAFNGCSSLKSVTITSTKLKSIGSNAFKGINAKTKYKVPKSRLWKYTVMILKAGASPNSKITK